MKLNKERQKLYLDSKVGLINDGTVEQLREVCRYGMFKGDVKYYTQKHHGHKEQFTDIEYHPISWFYEETELPKRVIVDKATQGTEWYKDYIGTAFNVVKELNSDDYIVEHLGAKSNYLIAKSDCTPITETTPSSYKLNIDIPEWELKAGTIGVKHKIYDNYLMFDTSMLPISLLPYIATPCTTFTLENGTQIELTANDIDKIKKL